VIGNGSPTLFQYQASGADALMAFLANAPRGALLADPPGAGKSAQAIEVMKRLGAGRVLILCPASLRINWAREIAMWTGRESTVIRRGEDDWLIPADGDCVVVTSYSLASRKPVQTTLAATRWDLLIMDEAHAVKSPSSNTARACLISLWRKCKYRLALTGTPVPNGRASEAWSLFSRMAPDLFREWQPFKERYCVEVETQYGITWPRSKHLDELGRIARERFMVRRSRSEVMAELPPLVRCVVPLDVPTVAVSDAEGEMDVAAVVAAIEAGTALRDEHISTARKKLGILKAQPALDYIVSVVLEEVESVVVFCHHKDVFLALKEGLSAFGVVCISGATSADDRQAAVDAFQAKRARVFLGSLTAANSGITLTAASTVVFVEFSWIPSENEQGEGRINRVTQTELMRAVYLVVPDSLDEAVVRSVLRKQKDIGKVMQEPVLKF
jgi:SWI/SNF-related matrix-associated actin-dependent regulator 1 of chromatin subfamily A